MTREQAIEAIKEAYGNSEYTDEIIKALEQEPILDKIRTEIEQLPITDTAIRLVDEILDKYKAESEDKE